MVRSNEEEETQTLPLAVPVAAYPMKKSFAEPPEVSARSVVILDKNSAVVLYAKNKEERLLPASTVKIMTALVALDRYALEEVLTVKEVSEAGQRVKLVPGEKIRVEDVLKALLVYSANDAAQVLAQNYPGGEKEFVEAMNQKAESLGLRRSHFANATGLDSGIDKRLLNDYSYATAWDLAQLARVALKSEVIAKIVATESTTISDADGQRLRKIENLNQLLGEVRGVRGVKTGWTEEAGECLMTFISREEGEVVMVLLGSRDRFGETKKLVDWVYDNFTWQQVFPTSLDQEREGRQ
jgi:D-alanyl-D-alanine carboxypeptidase (penicillin-binding protein 5/6)